MSFFNNKGESYKVELINELPDGEAISIYEQGDFADLCRGPHVSSTSKIKAFKLLSIAGAYWRGSEKNKMLQRIYGISFPDKEALDEYVTRLEEIKRRDHRKLGKDLDLFSISEESGGGLVLWHPRGALIRKTIEDFWRDEHHEERIRFCVFSSCRARYVVGDVGSSRFLPGEHVFFHGCGRAGILCKTDELPVPYHDLQEQAALVPRAAAAVRGTRYGIPVRALRRAARFASRSRLYTG